MTAMTPSPAGEHLDRELDEILTDEERRADTDEQNRQRRSVDAQGFETPAATLNQPAGQGTREEARRTPANGANERLPW